MNKGKKKVATVNYGSNSFLNIFHISILDRHEYKKISQLLGSKVDVFAHNTGKDKKPNLVANNKKIFNCTAQKHLSTNYFSDVLEDR